MTKALTELLAGSAVKQWLELHRNEPVSYRAKNKKSLSRKGVSKSVYLFCLDELRTSVDESYLSVLCVEVLQPGGSWTGLGMLKPTGISRSTSALSCWNDVWSVWATFASGCWFSFSLSLSLTLISSFPGMAQWWLLERRILGGGLDAHSLSLPLQLPVGLKSSMVLTGKEKEKEKKSGGWELSWPERSSIGRMSGC